jgi:hypothetical protein
LGRQEQQANAYLAPGLIRGKRSLRVYGKADGTGSNRSAPVARHRGISAALERWALYQTSQVPAAATPGFDVATSPNAMAAFRGFFKPHVRQRAITRCSRAGR